MSESTTATTREEVTSSGRTSSTGSGGFLSGPVGRNLGLVIALAILCIVGVITAGDRFADIDNVLTILRLAAVIGVVSIGMTFVIIGGGIDLSVGAIVALSSVWATTRPRLRPTGPARNPGPLRRPAVPEGCRGASVPVATVVLLMPRPLRAVRVRRRGPRPP